MTTVDVAVVLLNALNSYVVDEDRSTLGLQLTYDTTDLVTLRCDADVCEVANSSTKLLTTDADGILSLDNTNE